MQPIIEVYIKKTYLQSFSKIKNYFSKINRKSDKKIQQKKSGFFRSYNLNNLALLY